MACPVRSVYTPSTHFPSANYSPTRNHHPRGFPSRNSPPVGLPAGSVAALTIPAAPSSLDVGRVAAAGFGASGPFLDALLHTELAMLAGNCGLLVVLGVMGRVMFGMTRHRLGASDSLHARGVDKRPGERGGRTRPSA